MAVLPDRFNATQKSLRLGANPAQRDLGYAAGQLGFAERRTVLDQNITAGALITGLAVTVVVGANRRVKISAKLNTFSTNAEPTTDSVRYQILEDGIQRENAAQNVNSSSEQVMMLSTVRTPTSGSHTYTIFGVRNGGAGTITCRSQANQSLWLLVEDIGSAI